MRVGIIVYSRTGNTLTVARKIADELENIGHSVNVEQVSVEGDPKPGDADTQLINPPGIDGYDTIILGAPVHAFSLAGPMIAYLDQLESIDGRQVACFVTKHLPFAWTGGTRAIRTLKALCEAKHATVLGTEIVYWVRSRREKSIAACVDGMGKLFPA